MFPLFFFFNASHPSVFVIVSSMQALHLALALLEELYCMGVRSAVPVLMARKLSTTIGQDNECTDISIQMNLTTTETLNSPPSPLFTEKG